MSAEEHAIISKLNHKTFLVISAIEFGLDDLYPPLNKLISLGVIETKEHVTENDEAAFVEELSESNPILSCSARLR